MRDGVDFTYPSSLYHVLYWSIPVKLASVCITTNLFFFFCNRPLSWIKEKKMGAFLSVAKGSDEEPWFLEIKYNGGSKGQKPLALVGKGWVGKNNACKNNNYCYLKSVRFFNCLVFFYCLVGFWSHDYIHYGSIYLCAYFNIFYYNFLFLIGITFDTGGISIKPSASMGDMKADMGGAACVAGATLAIASLRIPLK